MNLLHFINKHTSRKHWYQIKVYYKSKSGKLIFDYVIQIGFQKQKDVLNHRKVMTTQRPLNEKNNVKNHLVNGYVYYEVMSYIGWMKV